MFDLIVEFLNKLKNEGIPRLGHGGTTLQLSNKELATLGKRLISMIFAFRAWPGGPQAGTPLPLTFEFSLDGQKQFMDNLSGSTYRGDSWPADFPVRFKFSVSFNPQRLTVKRIQLKQSSPALLPEVEEIDIINKTGQLDFLYDMQQPFYFSELDRLFVQEPTITPVL